MRKKKYLAGILALALIISMSFSLIANAETHTVSDGTNSYVVEFNQYDSRTRVTLVSNPQHVPLIITYGSYISTPVGSTFAGWENTKLYNLNDTLGGPAGSSIKDLRVGQVSGTATLPLTGRQCENGVLCPNSTVTITIDHGGNETFTQVVSVCCDSEGNAIGDRVYNNYRCSRCNKSWSKLVHSSVDSSYQGDIYDTEGNKTGSVTIDENGHTVGEGSGGHTFAEWANQEKFHNIISTDPKFSIPSGNFGEAGSVAEYKPDACTTYTFTYCTQHKMYGEHYYCSEHDYLSPESSHIWSDWGPYRYNAECYQYHGDQERITIYPISASGIDGITVMPHYISTVAGATIPVTVSNLPSPSYRYTIKDASSNIIASGTKQVTDTTFSFTRPASSVQILVEPVYKQQQVITASDLNLCFNQTNCKISATVAAA